LKQAEMPANRVQRFARFDSGSAAQGARRQRPGFGPSLECRLGIIHRGGIVIGAPDAGKSKFPGNRLLKNGEKAKTSLKKTAILAGI
jgi:hypothetical protein